MMVITTNGHFSFIKTCLKDGYFCKTCFYSTIKERFHIMDDFLEFNNIKLEVKE